MDKLPAAAPLTTNAPLTDPPSKTWFKNPQVWYVGGLLLIVVIGLAWHFYPRHRPPKTNVITSCTTGSGANLLQQAEPLLDPAKVDQLKPVADKIMTIKNYQADPNCLYVLTTYYINLSDAAKSRQMLTLLKAVYKPATGYSSVLGDNTSTPDQLESSVVFLEQQADQPKTYLFGSPQ